MTPFLHIWQADLAANHPSWPAAEATLSPAEQSRQAQLRTPALRQTYGRAHGLLRAVMGTYLARPAQALAFSAEATSKPVLPGSALHFNLSYRPSRALLALSNAAPVGADIEPLAPLAEAGALISELFSYAEQAALQAAEAAAYWPLFYLIWTRKEAYAKALGMGLQMPFSSFSVLDYQANASLLISPAGASLHSFGVGAGHQGAVAQLGSSQQLVPQHFSYPLDLEATASQVG